ncbi:hypothetical protein COB52_06095 [Candidatus Kaiserbacteria bacterium]|nr:MAG: hypothetical protein COB52_06095 [Candidatus Kaiserbacteria bacterium]
MKNKSNRINLQSRYKLPINLNSKMTIIQMISTLEMILISMIRNKSNQDNSRISGIRIIRMQLLQEGTLILLEVHLRMRQCRKNLKNNQ